MTHLFETCFNKVCVRRCLAGPKLENQGPYYASAIRRRKFLFVLRVTAP